MVSKMKVDSNQNYDIFSLKKQASSKKNSSEVTRFHLWVVNPTERFILKWNSEKYFDERNLLKIRLLMKK